MELIKKDFNELKIYLVSDNDINNWDKIIVIYTLYLFFNHLYILYVLMDIIKNDNRDFALQFKNVYIFFFILCGLRTSYLYSIKNISRINSDLSCSLFKNTKKYFY